MSPTGLTQLRPYAFHITTPVNFAAIRHWRRLRSAYDLLTGTAYEHLLRERRTRIESVIVEKVPVEIRDQRPLRQGHLAFEPGFAFADLLMELNSRVFLWPGTATGPIDRGTTHFKRYAAEGGVVVLRCLLDEFITINGEDNVYVATCNSGAPRRNPLTGPSVRGPSTFTRLVEAKFRRADVKELSSRSSAALPASTEWAESFRGPWQRVWPAA
jgi:hypothetical protein